MVIQQRNSIVLFVCFCELTKRSRCYTIAHRFTHTDMPQNKSIDGIEPDERRLQTLASLCDRRPRHRRRCCWPSCRQLPSCRRSFHHRRRRYCSCCHRWRCCSRWRRRDSPVASDVATRRSRLSHYTSHMIAHAWHENTKSRRQFLRFRHALGTP
jgi:hypothetical protein